MVVLPGAACRHLYRRRPCRAYRPCCRRRPATGSPNRSGSWPKSPPGPRPSTLRGPESDRSNPAGLIFTSTGTKRSADIARNAMSRSPVRMTAEVGTVRPAPMAWLIMMLPNMPGSNWPSELDSSTRTCTERDISSTTGSMNTTFPVNCCVGNDGNRYGDRHSERRYVAIRIQRPWPASTPSRGRRRHTDRSGP